MVRRSTRWYISRRATTSVAESRSSCGSNRAQCKVPDVAFEVVGPWRSQGAPGDLASRPRKPSWLDLKLAWLRARRPRASSFTALSRSAVLCGTTRSSQGANGGIAISARRDGLSPCLGGRRDHAARFFVVCDQATQPGGAANNSTSSASRTAPYVYPAPDAPFGGLVAEGQAGYGRRSAAPATSGQQVTTHCDQHRLPGALSRFPTIFALATYQAP